MKEQDSDQGLEGGQHSWGSECCLCLNRHTGQRQLGPSWWQGDGIPMTRDAAEGMCMGTDVVGSHRDSKIMAYPEARHWT